MSVGASTIINEAPDATTARNIHVAITQSSGRSPAVQLVRNKGSKMLMGDMHADNVAMCCFGTPRSKSLSCVKVSAAEKAMARVIRMQDSLITDGSRTIALAC